MLFGDTYSSERSDRAKRLQVVDLSTTPATFEDFAVYDFVGFGNPLDVTEGPVGSVSINDIFRGQVYRISHGG